MIETIPPEMKEDYLKAKEIIESAEGKIVKETNEGKKRLAYSIKGNEYACYYYYELELPAQAPQKISSALNITDESLRYLLCAVDPRKAKYEALKKSTESEEENDENSEEN